MKFLKQGAEALIYEDEFDGQKVLVKERLKKRYRLAQIDEKLRKERTRQEIKLMSEARGHGIQTPKVISSDEKSWKIIMEKIDGVLVKDFLQKSKGFEKVCFHIGTETGKLHSSGIIHGDLTTSNMILGDGKIYFLDFGLGRFSRRIEDMATDLNVFLEALRATHYDICDNCRRGFARGYGKENKKSEEVFERMRKIESRARYKEKTN